MKVKNEKALYALLFISCILLGTILWFSLRPVEIVAVHQKNNYSDILVKNFPFTDKGKIHWWLRNKAMLKEKYHVPSPAKGGFYTVIFWDFGEGYKETDGNDRLCFDDMKTDINCIDKEKYFTVRSGRNNTLSFSVHDGEYRFTENGELVKRKYE